MCITRKDEGRIIINVHKCNGILWAAWLNLIYSVFRMSLSAAKDLAIVVIMQFLFKWHLQSTPSGEEMFAFISNSMQPNRTESCALQLRLANIAFCQLTLKPCTVLIWFNYAGSKYWTNTYQF